MSNDLLISIVDDDCEFCAALTDLAESSGLAAEAYPCAEDLLASPRCWRSHCLILDVRLPGSSGIALQRILRELGSRIPVIFVTAYPSEALCAQALADGALCIHEKPFDGRQLMICIRRALGFDPGESA